MSIEVKNLQAMMDEAVGRYCEVYQGQHSWQQKLKKTAVGYSVGEGDSGIDFVASDVAWIYDAGNMVFLWLDSNDASWVMEEIDRLSDLSDVWEPNVVRKKAFESVLERYANLNSSWCDVCGCLQLEMGDVLLCGHKVNRGDCD